MDSYISSGPGYGPRLSYHPDVALPTGLVQSIECYDYYFTTTCNPMDVFGDPEPRETQGVLNNERRNQVSEEIYNEEPNEKLNLELEHNEEQNEKTKRGPKRRACPPKSPRKQQVRAFTSFKGFYVEGEFCFDDPIPSTWDRHPNGKYWVRPDDSFVCAYPPLKESGMAWPTKECRKVLRSCDSQLTHHSKHLPKKNIFREDPKVEVLEVEDSSSNSISSPRRSTRKPRPRVRYDPLEH